MSCHHVIEADAARLKNAGPQDHPHSCMCPLCLLPDATPDAMPAPVTAKPGFLQTDDVKWLCIQPCEKFVLQVAEAPAVP